MVKRAVFSWWSRGRRHGADFGRAVSIHKMHLWLLSVSWAREWFDEVILFADAEGEALLVAMGMPFHRVQRMPDLPPELGDIYALGKLAAHVWAAGEGVPYVVIDHDAWFTLRPSERLLRAATCGQQWEPLSPGIREINARLACPLEICGQRSKVTGALLGGCDTAALGAWSQRVLGVALDAANRELLAAQHGVAGFCAASLLEEVSFGAAFPAAAVVGAAAEDARQAGYMHLAGAKDEPAHMALVENRLRARWPRRYASLEKRYSLLQAANRPHSSGLQPSCSGLT